MRRRRRTRAHTLAEVVFATALAGLLLAVHGEELHRQQVSLHVVSQEAQAREELMNAYERLRAGLLEVPRGEKPVELKTSVTGVKLTIERRPCAQPRVTAVRLRVRWRGPNRVTLERELTTLVGRTP